MTEDTRPPPPYTDAIRAKGWRFELDYEQIEQSDTWSLTIEQPLAQPHLLMQWLAAWKETPCGSLPNDEGLIRVRARVSIELWPSIRHILMRGWWLASDGRLYHDTLIKRAKEMMSRRRSDADRQAKKRERDAAQAGSGSSHAEVTPKSRVTLQQDGAEYHHAGVTRDMAKVTRDKAEVTRDTGVSHASVTPESGTDNRPQVIEPRERVARAQAPTLAPAPSLSHGNGQAQDQGHDQPEHFDDIPPPPADDGEDVPMHEVAAEGLTLVGVRQSLIRGGFQSTRLNASDPNIAKIAAGAYTASEIEAAAREAVNRGKHSIAYVAGILGAKRREAEDQPSGLTFSAWVTATREAGHKAIAPDDRVFDYADSVGLPPLFVDLCWAEFEDRGNQSERRSVDWREEFRNAVREDKFRMWRKDMASGEWRLKTAGVQRREIMNNQGVPA